jgi:hypothetical protein
MSERPLNKRRRLTWRSKTGGGSLRATCPAVSPPWPMSGDLGHRWARSRTPWHWQADAPAPAQSRGPSRRGGPPHRWAPVCLPCGLAVLRLAGQPDSVPGLRAGHHVGTTAGRGLQARAHAARTGHVTNDPGRVRPCGAARSMGGTSVPSPSPSHPDSVRSRLDNTD